MFTALLMASLSTASATDIGTDAKVGLGLHFGTPSGLTGKLFTGEHQGFVLNVEYDPLYTQLGGVRAGYEVRLAELGDWHWGVLDLNGKGVVAVQAGKNAWLGSAVRVGAGGGLTLSALIKETPLEIYTEAQVVAYPLALAGGAYWTSGIIGVHGGTGLRYYF
jgi:hypothetical protein